MINKTFANVVGWYGTVAILIAYALVSFAIITPQHWLFQILNLTGGIGIVVISFARKAYPPGILNLIWSVIALVAIIKIFWA